VRSSDRNARSRPPAPETVVALVLVLLCAFSVAWLRPRLLARFEKIKLARDAYALPSPEQTLVASLGYRSALADLIYGSVLVSYGLAFSERRPFEFAGAYLDTMTTLDPKFGAPYYISDTLLTLQPTPPPVENYIKAREILERGMRARPEDSRVWIQAGQFMAYLGPGKLTDPEVKREWRMAGARALARACELLAEDEFQPHHCISAAGLLSR
jgi:tetratricopeptide (TPR) repeat protein